MRVPLWLVEPYAPKFHTFSDPLSQLQYAIEDPSVPIERVVELAERRAELTRW